MASPTAKVVVLRDDNGVSRDYQPSWDYGLASAVVKCRELLVAFVPASLLSDMFDWNDEELANIIWGAADKSDDHIVPYNEASDDYCNKKEWKQESHTIKPTE
ncbi:hypothetical protein ACFX1X_028224 [Malus domestica]